MEFNDACQAISRITEHFEKMGDVPKAPESQRAQDEFAQLILQCNEALDSMNEMSDIQATKPDPEMVKQVQQLLNNLNNAMQTNASVQARVGELYTMIFGKEFKKFKEKLKKVKYKWKFKVENPEKKEQM